MISEIKRGVDICQQITNNQSEWSVLFEPRNFFNDYKYLNKNDLKFKIRVLFAFWKKRHFIVLFASTNGDQQYMDWVRLVESRIRILIQNLEKNSFISLAHINPQGYQEVKEKLIFKIN